MWTKLDEMDEQIKKHLRSIQRLDPHKFDLRIKGKLKHEGHTEENRSSASSRSLQPSSEVEFFADSFRKDKCFFDENDFGFDQRKVPKNYRLDTGGR